MKNFNAIAIIATLLLLFATNVSSQSLTIDEQIPTGTFSVDHVFEHLLTFNLALPIIALTKRIKLIQYFHF